MNDKPVMFDTVKIACDISRQNFNSENDVDSLFADELHLIRDFVRANGLESAYNIYIQSAVFSGIEKGIELGREQLLTEQQELARKGIEALKSRATEIENKPELTSNDIVCAFVEIQHHIAGRGKTESFELILTYSQTQVTGIAVADVSPEGCGNPEPLDITASLEHLRALGAYVSNTEIEACLILL